MNSTRITTHVLDAATGVPAEGVPVELSGRDGDSVAGPRGRRHRCRRSDHATRRRRAPARGSTGSASTPAPTSAPRNVDTFYPEAVVTFLVADDGRHVHVPLLLSPFAYSTYRGS